MTDICDTPPCELDVLSPAAIGQIARWMQDAGIDRLELACGDEVRLRLNLSHPHHGGLPENSAAAPAPQAETRAAQQDPHCVTAPYFGVLTFTGQGIDLGPGTRLRAGDVIAHLELGLLTIPIQAHQDGCIIEVLAQEGSIIGYGTPIVSMLT